MSIYVVVITKSPVKKKKKEIYKGFFIILVSHLHYNSSREKGNTSIKITALYQLCHRYTDEGLERKC